MGKTIGLILALQDKCSPNIKKIADKIGITEKEAKKLDNQLKKLSNELNGNLKKACTAVSAGIGAVVATAGVLVNKSMEAGDRIDKMSQKIGMSRKAFQEWDYIMSQNGGSVDSLQMGYKTLASQMNGVQKGSKDSIANFKKLGVAVKDSNGQLRSQEDVFNDSIRALQRIKNPTEKAIMAQKLFGKSAIELKPLLNQTAESVDGLRQKANDLGMVMSDDAVDAGVKLKDTIDTVQRTFSAFGNQIGAEIMPIVQELADELITHLPQIKSVLTPVFQGLSNTIKFLIDHFDGVIFVATTCLSTFMAFKAISGVITTIKTLQTVIKAVSLAQGVWNALMIANPIGLIATGIGLLIGGIVLLIKNWDKVTEAVKKAIDAVKKFVGIKPKANVKVEAEQPEAKTQNSNEKPKVKKNAVGTSYYSGGSTRINEFGGEIVDLPQGSRIYPKDKSEKMANNSTSVSINLNVAGNVIGNREFFDEMMKLMAIELRKVMPA